MVFVAAFGLSLASSVFANEAPKSDVVTEKTDAVAQPVADAKTGTVATEEKKADKKVVKAKKLNLKHKAKAKVEAVDVKADAPVVTTEENKEVK